MSEIRPELPPDAPTARVKDAFLTMVKAGQGPQFANRFYQKLFGTSPQIRNMFPNDMRQLNRKLVATLTIVLNSLDDEEKLRAKMAEMAQVHRKFSLRNEHIELFVTCMLLALEDVTQQAVRQEVTIGFRKAFLAIAAPMVARS